MPISEQSSGESSDQIPAVYSTLWTELTGPRSTSTAALAQQLRLLYQRRAQLRRSLSPRRTSDEIDIPPEQVEAAARTLQQTGAMQVAAAPPVPAAVPFPHTLLDHALEDPCPFLVESTDLMNIDSDSDFPLFQPHRQQQQQQQQQQQEGSGGAEQRPAVPAMNRLHLALGRSPVNFRGQHLYFGPGGTGSGGNSHAAGAHPRRGRPVAIAAASTAAAAAAGGTSGGVVVAVPVTTEELPHSRRIPPPPCSFLAPGVKFTGTQRLVQQGPQWGADDWNVAVTIQAVDWEAGSLAGTMTATNVPGAKASVTTCWEGQVINDRQHTFYTRAWGASRDTDLRHWGRLRGFSGIRSNVVKQSGRAGCLAVHPYIYLRLKEKYFVNAAAGCRLTIAGFYYIALCRKTGRVQGLYFDPHSSPLQELDMRVDLQQQAGMSFGCYEMR